MALTHARDSRWQFAGAAVAIILAATAAYHKSFSGPFVLDDTADIAGNPTIRHLWALGTVLSPPTASGLTVSGRPLVNLSLAVNYALGGTDVRGYHALNLLIHVLAGLTLFGIVRRTLEVLGVRRSLLLAWATALLWTLHPLQTESVTYVIQRAESLMGLFYLLTLYCFIRGAFADRAGPDFAPLRGATTGEKAARRTSFCWFGLSCLACLFGMATKEVMVSAPLIVFLYDRTFVSGTFRQAWRSHRKTHLGLAASWLLLAFCVHATGGRGGTAGFGTEIPWPIYALTQFKAVALYLVRSIWPQPLVFDYGPASALRLNGIILPATIVLALLAATASALFSRKAGARALGFAGVWFFAILAPSSSVVPVASQIMAEHRMYLPLAAVIAVAVVSLGAVLSRSGWVVFGALAVVLGVLTERRNEVYRSALALWTDTVAGCPDNARAHFNLGAELDRQPNRRAEALVQYEAALRIEPDYAEANYNVAVELARIPGRSGEAIAHYEKTLQIDPDNALAHYNLAIELARIPGRGPEAIAHDRAAVRLKPEWAEAHNSLGIELAKFPGHEAEAAAEFSEALRIKPDFAEAHSNLAVQLGIIPERQAEAIGQFEAALRLKPNYVEAHYNLANELARDPGRLPEAIEHYEAALRLKPDFVEAHVNAAVSYAKLGRMDDAIRHLEAALRLNPNQPGIRDILENLRAAKAQ